MEYRRLRGHGAATTCCIASRFRPGLVATVAEDGFVCLFDLRCKDVLFKMDVANGCPISSLCFKPGNEDVIYVSAGNEIKSLDVHMAASWKQLGSYSYNKDEINQIVFHSKASFLAAADDAGDVKIVDTHQRCPYKTLRAGHNSICSSVQFVPWSTWEVVSGGLDSKLVIWDFSKGRKKRVIDFGSRVGEDQYFNPAFIHNLVVPEVDMVDRLGKICVAARGDGVVSVLKIDSKNDAAKFKTSVKPKSSEPILKDGASSPGSQKLEPNEGEMHIDYSMGGHRAAVSSVTFSMFGEKGKFIISGGNDRVIKVWNSSKLFGADQTSIDGNLLCSSISLNRKVNWICTTPTDSENLVVCDTSKVVKVYTVG